MISIKAAKNVTDERELLSHGLSQFLHNDSQIKLSTHGIRISYIIPRVLIQIEHLKTVVENCHLFTWQQVLNLEKITSFHIQMHSLFQEPACHDTKVPLWRLVNRQRVIEQMKVEDKESIDILWFR